VLDIAGARDEGSPHELQMLAGSGGGGPSAEESPAFGELHEGRVDLVGGDVATSFSPNESVQNARRESVA
jgi:hypothetical protein